MVGQPVHVSRIWIKSVGFVLNVMALIPSSIMLRVFTNGVSLPSDFENLFTLALFSDSLGFLVESKKDKIYHAVHMYAVLHAYNGRRAKQCISGPEAVDALIWQGLKIASLQLPSLRETYNEILLDP